MDKENKGMRLVAMIGKKNSDEYEVINFLPDIKVKYIKKNEFVVVENINYIKIPYAKGIDDLTVIVGENGVGKTRLVNTISNISSKETFIPFSLFSLNLLFALSSTSASKYILTSAFGKT